VTLGAPELGSLSGSSASSAPLAGARRRRVPSEPGIATASLATAGAANENAGNVVCQSSVPFQGSIAAATQVPAAESFERP
jgi:hypothetical protein